MSPLRAQWDLVHFVCAAWLVYILWFFGPLAETWGLHMAVFSRQS